jgi:hypothetical protein
MHESKYPMIASEFSCELLDLLLEQALPFFVLQFKQPIRAGTLTNSRRSTVAQSVKLHPDNDGFECCRSQICRAFTREGWQGIEAFVCRPRNVAQNLETVMFSNRVSFLSALNDHLHVWVTARD